LGWEEEAIIKSFCDALDFGLVGIDLMYHMGKPVFNEIEDVVGCRMLYSQTDLDPVSMYLDYILQNLSKTKQESFQKL
jgi:glutathione synthase/RimK-type ligase-like ATP-grasp enzyme